MKIPNENPIKQAVDKACEVSDELPRDYLGGSIIGHHCTRYLWLNFRWAFIDEFNGRMRRLFRRGHLEEETAVHDLREAGMDVRYALKNQVELTIAPHIKGHPDGVIYSGVPGAEKTKHLLEIKTHNDKSFKELHKKGLTDSKPMHYAQMQVYMSAGKLTRALYYPVNKNDDNIAPERLKFAKQSADNLVKRAEGVVYASRPPERISADPGWYQCKMCSMHDLCHESKLTKEANCRTCAHSTPLRDGTWKCERHNAELSLDRQRAGCTDHIIHLDLVPWKFLGGDEQGHTATFEIDGKEVINGNCEGAFKSVELLSNTKACVTADPGLMSLRKDFNGTIVG